MDYSQITHLNIAFANPGASGNLTTFHGLSTAVNNAYANHVKVIISLGRAELKGTKKNRNSLTSPDRLYLNLA